MEEIKRPNAGTVLGILNIIFCSLGLISSLFSFIAFGILNAITGSIPVDPYNEFSAFMSAGRAFFSISIIITIFQTGFSGTGLAGGISLLQNGRKSIFLCNIYAIGTIVVVILNFVFSKLIINRLFNELIYYADVTQDEIMVLDMLQRILPGFTGIISIVFGTAYPIIVLALLNRKTIREYYVPDKTDSDQTPG